MAICGFLGYYIEIFSCFDEAIKLMTKEKDESVILNNFRNEINSFDIFLFNLLERLRSQTKNPDKNNYILEYKEI